jgi:Rhodopirellula transposase DDE domain
MVTHFLRGTPKWNLIEHRIFSVVRQNWAGRPLISYEKVLEFLRTSQTNTGFRCRAHLDRRKYKNASLHKNHDLVSIYIRTSCFRNRIRPFDQTRFDQFIFAQVLNC